MESFEKYIYEKGMTSWQVFLSWLTLVVTKFPIIRQLDNNKRLKSAYYNVPAAFDIETSSFRLNDRKIGTMYIWQFGIFGKVCYGRTWEEFKLFIMMLSGIMGLNEQMRLVVYVHNLQFEFQWIRKHFTWDKVFLLEKRVPVTAVTGGIEFRCSLKLAGGISLATVGKNLIKYKVEKLTGDLDYNLVRGSETPLTEQELSYCENDIRVVMAYIMEKIENDGDVSKIPLTNTGYVRRYCRDACFPEVQKV